MFVDELQQVNSIDHDFAINSLDAIMFTFS